MSSVEITDHAAVGIVSIWNETISFKGIIAQLGSSMVWINSEGFKCELK